MGNISSLFQGVLFAVFSTAVFAYMGQKLGDDFNVPIFLAPRLVVFHFCMSFILGMSFLESISVRLDQNHGPVIGPMGTFLATLLALFFTEVVVLLTYEIAILTPIAFAVAYTYGRTKAANFISTKYGPFFCSCNNTI